MLRTCKLTASEHHFHENLYTDIACEAVRALYALSGTEAGWPVLLQHKDAVIAHVERFLQQHGAGAAVEDQAVARALLYRCRQGRVREAAGRDASQQEPSK